mmetsp:Transcript_8937/g.13864  ORF Transcript_8937/g.13864 Transcript_8937/m.13864 type:complete len:422 (-) Transcript_8937:186-1451(-)
MSSSGEEVSLPIGKLGIVFRGCPPVIKSINDTSPLQDQVAEGFVVESLKLGNGIVYEDLNSTDLVQKLKENARSADRKLVIQAPGIVWAKDGSAASHEFNPASPVRELFHIGYIVEKPVSGEEEDGQEIEVVLSSNAYVKTSSDSIKPANEMQTIRIDLPLGKLGLFFKKVNFNGKKLVYICKISDTSPMKDSLKVGDIVEELELPERDNVRGFSKEELGEHIASSSEMDGRVLIVQRQEGAEIGTMSISTLDLPAGKLGVVFKGNKKRVYVSKISEDSPMKDIFQVGDIIDTLELPDGQKSSNFNSSQLGESLKQSSDNDGRVIIVKRKKSTTKSVTKTFDLPEGKLGVVFRGSKSVFVSKVSDTSHAKDLFQAGDVVESIELPDGEKYSEFTSTQLGEHLKNSMESKGRKMSVKRQECA